MIVVSSTRFILRLKWDLLHWSVDHRTLSHFPSRQRHVTKKHVLIGCKHGTVCFVANHLKFEGCWIRFTYDSWKHASNTAFLKSLDRGTTGLRLRSYLLIENISTTSSENLSRSRLHPSRKGFFPPCVHAWTTGKINVMRLITAPFNNMRTLKFKAQPTNAFFATVNQMFGGSFRLPTTAERAVIKSNRWAQLR